jgi:OOP family OmpA-OmpF porin
MKQLHRAGIARGRRASWSLSLLALSALPALVGCGGVIKFEDRSAIAITKVKQAPPLENKRVEMKDDHIEINEKIKFAYNDATILSESFSLLNEIADVIKKNPQIKKIEVGGHASSEGDDSKNLALSNRRAQAVVQYLTTKGGIAADHLVAKGYGETKPLVTPDDTDDKREKNRRVEFLVLDSAPAAQAKK